MCIARWFHVFTSDRLKTKYTSNVIFVTFSFIQNVPNFCFVLISFFLFEDEILLDSRLRLTLFYSLFVCLFHFFFVWRFFIVESRLPYGEAPKELNVILQCIIHQHQRMRIMVTIKHQIVAQIERMPNMRNVQLAQLKVRYLFCCNFNCLCCFYYPIKMSTTSDVLHYSSIHTELFFVFLLVDYLLHIFVAILLREIWRKMRSICICSLYFEKQFN